MILDRTPIDHLDFASPLTGLGGKLGIDATRRIGSETTRGWGEVMRMSGDVEALSKTATHDIIARGLLMAA